MLTLLLGIVLVLALVWKLSQLAKAPSDRLLQAVSLCLVCAALAYPLGLAPGARATDSLIGGGTAKLLQNVFLLGAVYALQCFFLHSASDRDTGRRRARRELIPLGLTVAVITLAMLVTPESERSHTYATANMRLAGVAVFYLTAGLYLVYSLAMALWWTVRHARVSGKPLRTGLRLVATALSAIVLAGAVREVLNVVRWLGGEVHPAAITGAKLLLDLAIPLFVVGIIYPATVTRWATARLWWHHRRTYRRLGPLWTALNRAFPEDALNRTPSSAWRDTLRVTGVHRRYYRRVIECRDGLVHISPYLARPGPDEEPSGPLTPEVVARRLPEALRAHTVGEPVSTRAVPVALPSGDGLDDDVRQLVALSDALQKA
ncbi:hypothetical protein FE633_24330 [Streptomyces montanus]|uniref:DUF6545 domain-containing protein n=1 Tax=Streptomyces montanus TaxID=2580423 RepID=A0A5R9FQG3_9ACTN|nr:MAB_1171c family putative transporter [Streptomyces montanus]TLS43708.1 hypothetical protein FE633_24330 [Streptomyces montanus]